MAWKTQVEGENVRIAFSREDVLCQSNWVFRLNSIVRRLRRIHPPSPVANAPEFKMLHSVCCYRLSSILFHCSGTVSNPCPTDFVSTFLCLIICVLTASPLTNLCAIENIVLLPRHITCTFVKC